MGARGAAEDVPGGEPGGDDAAGAGSAPLRRGDRAALRRRLGHRRGRPPGDERAGRAIAVEPVRARRAAEAHRRGLVPRLLARHLGRRPSGARRVHVLGRAERGAGAAVRDPVAVGDGGDTVAADGALGDVPVDDGGARAVRASCRDRAAARRARPGDAAACADDRLRRRDRGRARRDAGLRADGDGAVRAPLGVVGRCARPAHARLVVRPRVSRPRAAARALRVRGRRSRSGSTGPSGRSARSQSSWRCSARCLRAAPRCSLPAPRDTRPRRRRAGCRSCSTGCTSPRARCGSAA